MGYWERIELPWYQFWSDHVIDPKEIEKGRRVFNGQVSTSQDKTFTRFEAEAKTGVEGKSHSLIIERNYYSSNCAFISSSPAPFVLSGTFASGFNRDDVILKDPENGKNKKVNDFFGSLYDLDDSREVFKQTTQKNAQLTSIQVYIGNFDGKPGDEIAFKLKGGAYAVFRWVE